MRSLTVFSSEGLCNRLRVLTSGLALAEATGRTFHMLWPKSATCYAEFQELFENEWSIGVGRMSDLVRLGDLHYDDGDRKPNLADSGIEHLRVSAYTWLLHPSDQVCARLIGQEIEPVNRADPTDSRRIALIDRTKEYVRQLQPAQPVQRAIDDFRAANFRTRMIGVHLRRGDFINARPDFAGNTAEAMAEVDRILALEPDAGILLCSDDGAADVYSRQMLPLEGVHEKFRRRYGARVVWIEHDLASVRLRRDGVQALIDLWLLRSTDYFIGTPWSSFSQMARVARDVPSVVVPGYIEKMRTIVYVLRVIRAVPLVQRYGRRRFGHDVPLFMALRQLKKDMRRALTGRQAVL